jgi:hypothetical protein
VALSAGVAAMDAMPPHATDHPYQPAAPADRRTVHSPAKRHDRKNLANPEGCDDRLNLPPGRAFLMPIYLRKSVSMSPWRDRVPPSPPITP